MGLEPITNGSQCRSKNSIKIAYLKRRSTIKLPAYIFHCTPDGIRTHDPSIKSRVL